MEGIVCENCRQCRAVLKCKCINANLCDSCFAYHFNSYPNFMHIPELFTSTLNPNTQLILSAIFSEKLEISQKKQELLNKFCSRVMNLFASIPKQFLETDKNNLNVFKRILNQSVVSAEEFGKFNLYLSELDKVGEEIESCGVEKKIEKYKNELNEEMKKAITNKYCDWCYNLNEVVHLDCSHSLCTACLVNCVNQQTNGLFVLNEQEHPSPILCPISACRKEILKAFIKNHLPNYNEYEERSRERIIFTCKKCKKTGQLEEFQVKCRHFCEECTINQIRDNILACPECETPLTEQELSNFKSKELTCEGCDHTKNWLKCFHKRLCMHLYCLSCLSECKEQICFNNCPHFNLNQVEFESIFKIKCNFCRSRIHKSEAYWIEKNCQCPVCLDCQAKKSATHCLSCSNPLNAEIEEIVQKRINYLANTPKKTCPVCLSNVSVEEIISMMNCTDEFCSNCILGNIEALVGDISKMGDIDKCMSCKTQIAGNQLEKQIFTAEVFQKYSLYKIQTIGINLIECPKCKTKFEPGFGRKVHCCNNECNFEFCKQCLEAYHEDGDCQEFFIEQRIKDMQQLEGGVTQCPRCRFPYVKDPKNCEHVDCLNNGCGISFCFVCACIRSPTIEHGNHYHRRNCRFWSDYDGRDDKMEAKCTECQRLGKKCAVPKSLRVERLVAKDEVE